MLHFAMLKVYESMINNSDSRISKYGSEQQPLVCGCSSCRTELDRKHKYRFAEQLRAATLSITNNIAEGSGSTSKVDFANFLNTARRSVYKVANILILLGRNGYLVMKDVGGIISELQEGSRMILAFMRTLRSS